MERYVRKRDGSIVEYDRIRIEKAIEKASSACEAIIPVEDIAKEIEIALHRSFFKKGSIPSVEEIQDIVERTLMEKGYVAVAKAYIIYRQKRSEARDLKSTLEEAENLIENYLTKWDWRVQENSNMNYSLQGMNFYISSSITARYWLNRIYPEDIKRAHDESDLHIHDLGLLAPYCVGWNLEDILKKGFGGVSGKITSKPPKRLRTALGQAVNFFYTLQGETAGAQAFSNFDTYLAPFIRYDNLNREQVKQTLQEFLFNCNVPTRVGFQTPFSNITLDLKVPDYMKEKNIIIGGKEMSEKYKDFQKEMDIFNDVLAELYLEGDGIGRIFTFPIPTINITKDFEWDNPVFKNIWKMTGKYGIPYFGNYVNSDMKPEDITSMCCRLSINKKELKRRSGSLFGAGVQTGSVGVVTINIPRIAYMSHSESEFFDRLKHLMILAKFSLEIKRKIVEDLTEKDLYPYSKIYLENVKQTTGKYWSNHFSTIGIVGMNEACMNFLGLPISSKEGREWTKKVLNWMREEILEFQRETGNLYNLEATPAEGVSYRFAKKDREKFTSIYTQGTFDAPYYTNSVHLPVNEEHDIFELLELQDDLQVLFTGGTVVHLFLGEEIEDWKIVRELVKKVVTRFKLPYFSITPTFSICPVHGYLKGKHEFCPFEHTKEDVLKYGMKIELSEEEIKELPKGSFVNEDETINIVIKRSENGKG